MGWDQGLLNEHMGKPRTREEGLYLKPHSRFKADSGERQVLQIPAPRGQFLEQEAHL